MNIRIAVRSFIIILAVACNIGCDQISKTIVRQKIDYYENIEIVKHHITLTKVENSGAFLSLGDSLPYFLKFILLALLPILVLFPGFAFILTKHQLPGALVAGLCFVIGGGIGNLYDRLVYGSVTDFLQLNFGLLKTGVFNMADVSIMTGMLLIFIQLIRKKHPQEFAS